MNDPQQPDTLPLEHAARIAYELSRMRRDCGKIAIHLLGSQPIDHAKVQDCARLDAALARAHRVLHSAIGNTHGWRSN